MSQQVILILKQNLKILQLLKKLNEELTIIMISHKMDSLIDCNKKFKNK